MKPSMKIVLRILLLLIPTFKVAAGDAGGRIFIYNIIVIIHCPLCGPRVGPTRSEALDT